jgi:hypothetical protein
MLNDETIARVDEIVTKLDEADGMFILGLLTKIQELQKTIRKQNDRLIEDSWARNPDRMGGQFTDEEIYRSQNGGW